MDAILWESIWWVLDETAVYHKDVLQTARRSYADNPSFWATRLVENPRLWYSLYDVLYTDDMIYETHNGILFCFAPFTPKCNYLTDALTAHDHPRRDAHNDSESEEEVEEEQEIEVDTEEEVEIEDDTPLSRFFLFLPSCFFFFFFFFYIHHIIYICYIFFHTHSHFFTHVCTYFHYLLVYTEVDIFHLALYYIMPHDSAPVKAAVSAPITPKRTPVRPKRTVGLLFLGNKKTAATHHV